MRTSETISQWFENGRQAFERAERIKRDIEDRFERCACGKTTHIHEAACIHCGATKSWAKEV